MGHRRIRRATVLAVLAACSMAAAGTIDDSQGISVPASSPGSYFDELLDVAEAGDDNIDWSSNTWRYYLDITANEPFDIIVPASNYSPAEDESEVTEYWVDARILNDTTQYSVTIGWTRES